MSNYRQSNGDDYPDAAEKHLEDAQVLLKEARFDGAGYHASYVIECTFKTLLIYYKKGSPKIHDLGTLSGRVGMLITGGSPTTAPYIPQPMPAIPYAAPPAGWEETMRYRASGDLSQMVAQHWVAEAQRVYTVSIMRMRMDGVIR